MKMLGLGENFGLGRFCVLHLNFPTKIWNFSGSGENFRFRQKLWVRVKILGLGENVGFVRKFWVLRFAFCILHFAFEFPAKKSEFF